MKETCLPPTAPPLTPPSIEFVKYLFSFNFVLGFRFDVCRKGALIFFLQ